MSTRGCRLSVLVLSASLLAACGGDVQSKDVPDRVSQAHFDAVLGVEAERNAAVRLLVERGDLDAVPTLILAMRHRSGSDVYLKAFNELTGARARDWFDAALWLEERPEVRAHRAYQEVKLTAYDDIDPNFRRFLAGPLGEPENMAIRLGEIYWGGVAVDGIPPLDRPTMVAAAGADYLLDGDLVFGVAINGDVRAYPLRILGWHEMMNDVIGGLPVALAYCTLCGSGILYETALPDRPEPLVFSTTGLLYRSNKLMYDRGTDSLWNQFSGEPVSGPLLASGIKLKVRPISITSWAKWRARHPESRVVSLDTGFYRNYGSGVVYRNYFASPDLMFPAVVEDESRVRRKDYVFALRDFAVAKAWPLDLFRGGQVINDNLGETGVVLIGEEVSLSVRAYARGGRSFAPGGSDTELISDGVPWRVEEAQLVGPDGTRLPRLPGHIAYWFAWENFTKAHGSPAMLAGG